MEPTEPVGTPYIWVDLAQYWLTYTFEPATQAGHVPRIEALRHPVL